MSEEKYRVVFKGDIQDGANPDDVKPKLAKILKISEDKAEKMLSGKAIVIKKNASEETCKKIQAALQKAGALCTIKQETPPKQEEPEFQFDAPAGKSSIKLKKQPEAILGKPTKKLTVILLAFFFGLFGFHKFYTNRNKMGYFYVLLSWTGISFVFSLLDIFVYLIIKKDKFEKKFRTMGTQKHMILGFFLALTLIGAEAYLLVTIGIPKYIEYRDRGYHIAVDHELHNFRVMQEVFYIDHNRYASSMQELKYKPRSPEILLKMTESSPQCYKTEGKHPALDYPRTIDCQGNIEDGFRMIMDDS